MKVWLVFTVALLAVIVLAFFFSYEVWLLLLVLIAFAVIILTLLPRPNTPAFQRSRNTRQPDLYGESKFADIPTMRAGGITSEKRP
jgi:hypothetical protein